MCDLSPAVAEMMAERFGVPAWFTDHRRMLAETAPDVVHVTTPPPTHVPLAIDALRAGSHVLVEKPAAPSVAELRALLDVARDAGRVVVEDQNYLFNEPMQRVLDLVEHGEFGAVTHVDAMICVDVVSAESPFADRNVPHPCLGMPGGAIADFLPHLAYLAVALAGAPRRVRTSWAKREPSSPLPSDEFRALIDGERATATLGFSGRAEAEVFSVRVYGTRMRAAVNLWEPRLVVDRRRGGPRPLTPVLNGWDEATVVRRAAFGGLRRKLAGRPGSYDGMRRLIASTYEAIRNGAPAPVTPDRMAEVAGLVAALTDPESAE